EPDEGRAPGDNPAPFLYRVPAAPETAPAKPAPGRACSSADGTMTDGLHFRRVLLKLSGEALLGEQAFGIDEKMVDRIAREIAEAVELGVKVGLVVGGGNIFRGMTIVQQGGNR